MNEKNVRVMVSKSLTLPRGDFQFVKITGGIESDLPVGMDALVALRDLEATLDLFLSNRTGSADRTPGRSIVNVDNSTETITDSQGRRLASVSFVGNCLIVSVEPALSLDVDSPPLQQFLIPKVLDDMWNARHIDSYEIHDEPKGKVRTLTIRLRPNDADHRGKLRRLTRAINWTLLEMSKLQQANSRSRHDSPKKRVEDRPESLGREHLAQRHVQKKGRESYHGDISKKVTHHRLVELGQEESDDGAEA